MDDILRVYMQAYNDRGALVPDQIILDMVRKRKKSNFDYL
jgi:hypothetical protein